MTRERTTMTTPCEQAPGERAASGPPPTGDATGDELAPRTPRRSVLAAGAALAGTAVSGAALAGCGGGSDTDSDSDAPEEGESPDAAGELALTSEIPVGGGKVFKEQKVVVTQPDEGTFKGFSAVCTHRGCTVANVKGGTINCTCHGSKFEVADGAVADGPATRPLPARKLKVSGDSISLG